jgi:hypothetical protein
MKKVEPFACMEDCIHLMACRRIQKIGKSLRLNVPRYCTEECSAYCSGENGNFLTVDEACNVARNQYNGNSDSYDVYCTCDFPGRTLAEIIEEMKVR